VRRDQGDIVRFRLGQPNRFAPFIDMGGIFQVHHGRLAVLAGDLTASNPSDTTTITAQRGTESTRCGTRRTIALKLMSSTRSPPWSTPMSGSAGRWSRARRWKR
jgi:hypothetical protein